LDILQAAVLGAVQGLTEFLPVSSSAHLILVRAFFGFDAERLGLAFDVACHVGTLVAVLAFFRDDLAAMIRSAPRATSRAAAGPARMVQLVVLGTVPVLLLGLPLSRLEDRLRDPWVAAAMLALGGALFLVAEWAGTRSRAAQAMTGGEALGIGLAQAAALVPGVSRSGATITLGLFFGLTRDSAARFSFLLGVPAILAAAAHEGLKVAKSGMDAAEVQLFAVGMVVSAVVGYATIKFLLGYLARHSLAVFAWYRFALAASVVAWWVLTRGSTP
jgi:undecaprenyl-diphosphatase